MKAPVCRDAVGCDVVSIHRFARILGRNPPTFRDELFTAQEHRQGQARIEELALCFAVKEATLKALGTGFIAGVQAQDVEVRLGEAGAPEIILRGALALLARARGATLRAETTLHAHHAMAVVYLLSPSPRGPA
jgi:holo-[acyl-carrier protein] synthase